MKKIIIFLLLLSSIAFSVDRDGRSDSFTLGDVLHSVYEGGWGYTSKPYEYIDSASVRDAINDQTLTISHEFMDASERWDTVLTTALTSRYALNADCIDPITVWVKGAGTDGDGTGITRINLNEVGYNTSLSDDPLPKYWTAAGQGTRYLILDAVPNDNDLAFILYRARSNDMASDTVTSNVSIKYYDLLVWRTIISLMNSNSGSMVDRIYQQALQKEAKLNKLFEESLALPIRIRQDVK